MAVIESLKFRAYQDNDMIYQSGVGNYSLAGFFATLYEETPLMQFCGFQVEGVDAYIGDLVNLKPYLRNGDIRLAEICVNEHNIHLKALDNGVVYGTFYIEKIVGNIYENPV